MRFVEVRKPRLEFVKTRDGWSLAVHRYWKGRGTSKWGPVLLVHGLGANRYDLDAPFPEISVARYLHQRAHDVWVIELRGSGKSRPPGWPLRRRAGWDFDNYVHLDIPAIMRRVLDATGTHAVNWVGHSMGGMLAYAALEHFDNKLFRAVVTIGAPAFTAVKHPLADKLYHLHPLLAVIPWIPGRALGKLAVLFPGLTLKTVGKIVANVDHMQPKHIRSLANRALIDLPAPLLKQVAEWYNGPDGFSRADGLLGYHAHLDRVTAPVLVIAGAGDVLTPVSDLVDVYERISSPDKKLLVCGREQGFSLDYGHIDLVLGTRARGEIYPHISGWIEEH